MKTRPLLVSGIEGIQARARQAIWRVGATCFIISFEENITVKQQLLLPETLFAETAG